MTLSDRAGVNHTEAPDGVRRLESELSVLFRRAREVFRIAAGDVHPELNVTGYATLIRVVDDGPVRASTLVDYFGTDKGSMSRHLAQLEQFGLVRRTKDPDDGRAQVVTATDDGVRRCGQARERSRAVIRELISDWDESRVDAFAALVHDFNSALEGFPGERSS